MTKYKCFIDYEKEEQWLNDMAQKGYQLDTKLFGYKFHATNPENTIIKIDYRTFKSREALVDYCTLFEDCGWEHIIGSKYSGAQYFKKININSDDDIFSDVSSKAGKYKRVSVMWLSLALCYFPIFLSFISTGVVDINGMLNPKSLYLTPGLWEKTGASFWGSFLFETPFAFSRGFIWIFIPLTMILSFCFAFKAEMLHKKIKSNSTKL